MKNTGDGSRRGVSAVPTVSFLVLLLILVGCGGERADAPEEETVTSESAASESTTAENSSPTRLTNLGAVAGPAFSPDGSKIAFLNTRGGLDDRGVANVFLAPADLYVMNVDGTDLINLTSNLTTAVAYPAFITGHTQLFSWSPDGAKVAFAGGRGGRDPPEIYLVNADGSNLVNRTNNAAGERQPAFSPDGTKVVFVSGRDGNEEIYVMNSDGSDPTNLSNNPGLDSTPGFSPDGNKITFARQPRGRPDIFVMNPDGADQTNLTNSPDADIDPAFSPDGQKITFVSHRIPPSQARSSPRSEDIYVMNVDGTNPINLNSSVENYRPVFSPDGKKIAFTSYSDSNYEVYVVNTDGTGLTNLTNNSSANDTQPAFSPDGKKMAFVSAGYDASGNYVAELYTMDVSGVD